MKSFQDMDRMMRPDDYQAKLTQLGWDHTKAAERLGVTERTSYNYAKRGGPIAIGMALEAFIRRSRPKLKRAAG